MATPTRLTWCIGLMAFSATASSQEPSAAISACTAPAQIAIASAQLRDSGKPKSEIESTLTQRDLALKTPTGRMMYATLDDVYEFSDVSVFSHYYYSMYTCVLQNEKRPRPASFKVVHDGVLACQGQYADSASGALGKCLMKAIDAGSTAPLGL